MYSTQWKTLGTTLGLDMDYCVAYARDSCSTNHAAVNRLMPASKNALNMLCFPHTLHNTGKDLQLPVLTEFMTSWLQLVPQPGAAKLRWEAIHIGFFGYTIGGFASRRR